MDDLRLISRFFSPRRLVSRIMDLGRVLRARYGGHAYPLFVQFHVTSRCNLECDYCEVPPLAFPEMSHQQVLDVLEELCRSGMRKITFTGGEPLVREELPDWIRFVQDQGVFANIITNGVLLDRRIDSLRDVDLIILSVDGPKEIHDAHRGEGSHQAALEGLELCRDRKIPVMTSTVVHSGNRDSLDYVLDLSRRFGTTALFQPVEIEHEPTRDRAASLLLDERQRREVFQYLLERRDQGDRIGYPRYLLEGYAQGREVPGCRWAGRLFCSVLPDGTVVPCNVLAAREAPWLNGRKVGFVHAMNTMPEFRCDGCQQGFVEMDRLLSFRLRELLSGDWIG